ncbi:hypothetical protein ACLB2K_021307 [Fragaria x ananassa]
MFKLLCWNVRGAGGKSFRSSISDLINLHKMDILVICEPRVPFAKAKRFLKKHGFPDAEIEEARGFSRAIWVLFYKNKIIVSFVDSNPQSVTVNVKVNNHAWLLTALYASPTHSVRSLIWNYLSEFASSVHLPWLIIGDFNDLYSSADKNGGSLAGKFGGMRSWVDSFGLVDLGFQGPEFTWTDKRVRERLDRSFCTDAWRIMFLEAFVQHLPRMKSDHCPLLLQLFFNVVSLGINKPFRFQAMWFQQEFYNDFVKDKWQSYNGDVHCKVNKLVGDLQEWNSKVLEEELIKEYELLRDQEAMYWQQKSRVSWLQNGDRNTNFFHLSTMVRRRNKIEGLFDNSGDLCTELGTMKEIAASFFNSLFTYKPTESMDFSIPHLFLMLDVDAIDWLSRAVSMEEVYKALFSIGGLKAPGVDGFPAVFFQKYWNMFSNEVFNLVSNAFSTGVIHEGLNHTLITLVPKEFISDLR